MHTLGASAPLRELQTKFVFTADSVYRVARETLEARRGQQ
jgi:Mor family transcriptional regulator